MPAIRGLGAREGLALRVMDEASFDRFLQRGRLTANVVTHEGSRLSAADVMADVNRAQTVFEELLRADEHGGLARQPSVRQLAHQLDMFLHAAR